MHGSTNVKVVQTTWNLDGSVALFIFILITSDGRLKTGLHSEYVVGNTNWMPQVKYSEGQNVMSY